MTDFLLSWVRKLPSSSNYDLLLTTVLEVVVIFLFAIICYYLVKRGLVYGIHKLFSHTQTNLDDVLVKRSVFNRIAYIVPAWLLYKLLPDVLAEHTFLSNITIIALEIYLVLIVMMILDSLIDSLLDVYRTFAIAKRVPIQSFGQVAKLLIYFIAVISIVSIVLDESPFKLFAGLGAMTAVLMLVFKDPILGFVAGLQLSYNKMVNLGDWVEIPQHNADGDILEIGLTTVKVQNFDNTITTVPTQSLINESFKNWRGMQESQGRRIKRAIYIDVNSIQFCNDESLAAYAKVDYIKDYIESKKQEVDDHNIEKGANPESNVNGRRLTNVGTFRAYILAFLKNHSLINQQLTILVRQLAPTDVGLPIEIYAFSTEKDWVKYEAIQADIFDHLFAVANEFDLDVFQKPTGNDLKNINKL